MTFKTFEPFETRTNSTQEHTKKIFARANNVNILNNTDKTLWHQEPTKNTAQEKAKSFCQNAECLKVGRSARKTTRPDMWVAKYTMYLMTLIRAHSLRTKKNASANSQIITKYICYLILVAS